MGSSGLNSGDGSETAHLVVLGGGPAGFGVLRALDKHRHDWARHSVILIDKDPDVHLGAGALGSYYTTSDTAGRVFLETAEIGQSLDFGGRSPQPAPLTYLHKLCDTRSSVSLDVASDLLRIGAAAFLSPRPTPGPQIVKGQVTSIAPRGAAYSIVVATNEGSYNLKAANVVIAIGGRPWLPVILRAEREKGSHLLHSDAVLRRDSRYIGCLDALPRKPRILVIGGSHSAFAATRTLLTEPISRGWQAGTVGLVHRHPIRVTYPDVTSAIGAGASFSDADICSKTGVVFRFAGLRTDSASLFVRIKRGHEKRVDMRLDRSSESLLDLCRSADLIVAATGYTSRASDLISSELSPGDDLNARPRLLVNHDAQMLDAHGRPRSGLFAIGLGSGALPDRDRYGGEYSYSGEVDGVWYYQQAIAPRIVAHIGRAG